jgi:hypothetical protein
MPATADKIPSRIQSLRSVWAAIPVAKHSREVREGKPGGEWGLRGPIGAPQGVAHGNRGLRNEISRSILCPDHGPRRALRLPQP